MFRYFKIIIVSIFLLLVNASSIYSMEDNIHEFKLPSSYANSFRTSLLADILLDLIDTKNTYSSFSIYEVKPLNSDQLIGLVYVIYSNEFGYQIVPVVKADSVDNDLLVLELINATVSTLNIKKLSIPTSLITKTQNLNYLGSYYEQFNPNNATYIEKTSKGDYKIVNVFGTPLNEFTTLTTFFSSTQWPSSFTLKERKVKTDTYLQVLNTIADVDSWNRKDHSTILQEVHSVFSDIYYFIDPQSLLKAHYMLLARHSELSDKVSLFDYLEALAYLDFSKINLNQNKIANKSNFENSKDISKFYIYMIENFSEYINFKVFYGTIFQKFFSNPPIELRVSVKYHNITHFIRSNRLTKKGEKNLYDILIYLHIHHLKFFEDLVSAMYSYNPVLVVCYLFTVPSIAISEILKLSDDEFKSLNIYKNVDNLSYNAVLDFIKKHSTKRNIISINKVLDYKKLIISLLLKSRQPTNLKWAYTILDQISSHSIHKLTIIDVTMIYSIFSGLNHLEIQDIKTVDELFIKSNLISEIKKLLIYSAHSIDYEHFNPSDPDLLTYLPKSVLDLIDKIDSFSRKILSQGCKDKFSKPDELSSDTGETK